MATFLVVLCEKKNRKDLVPFALAAGLLLDAALIKLLFSFLYVNL